MLNMYLDVLFWDKDLISGNPHIDIYESIVRYNMDNINISSEYDIQEKLKTEFYSQLAKWRQIPLTKPVNLFVFLYIKKK